MTIYKVMLFYIKLWQKGWEEKKFLITYILCARIDCGIRIRNCGPLIIIFKWRLAIQVKRFSREAIPFKRQPLQNVRVGWKLSNLRQKILERLVKNFEQISYSFSTNKPFTWNQHLHFKVIIKLIVTFVIRDFNSFVESFLLSFFSSFSVTYLRGEIVIYEYFSFSISYNLHQVIVFTHCRPCQVHEKRVLRGSSSRSEEDFRSF